MEQQRRAKVVSAGIEVADTTSERRRERRPEPAGEQGGFDLAISGDEVAHADGVRKLQPQGGERDERRWVGNSCGEIPDPDSDAAQGLGSEPQPGEHGRPAGLHDRAGSGEHGAAWPAEPDVGRVAHGVAKRVDRLKALGNGQVPRVAARAWLLLRSNTGINRSREAASG